MPSSARKAPASAEELAREFGQLEGFAHPRMAASLFGHDGALANLRAAREHDRLHHAWLFSGPHGIGKATLAYRFAGELLDDAGAARQIAAGSHPNLRSLSRPFNEKTKKFAQAIPVDAVRRIKAFLGATAAQEGYRVVIVDQADDLNISAANALLKMLEEPPALTVFFLISSEPGRLLPTIRSRCRALPLQPLGPFDLENAIRAAWAAGDAPKLDAAKPEGEALSRIAALSGGSVRRALEISAGTGLALVDQLLSIFANLPSLDYRKVHALADKVTLQGAEQDFDLTVTLLLDLIRRFVRRAAESQMDGAQSGEISAFERPLSRLSDAGTLHQWAALWGELVAENRMTAALNLDKRNFLIFCFDRLQATARQTMAQAGAA